MIKVFDEYSKYYDLLYKDKDYIAESKYISDLIKRFSPNSKTVLELGCGTGKHALLLNQKGYEVFGIDLSQTMLDDAKKNGIDCTIGDARTFRANKTFDTVLSLFHVASYQSSDEDLLDYFNTASLHLKPGDIFIFDCWYKPAVLAQLPEKRTKELENDDLKIKRFCKPNHIKEKSIVEVNYDIEITDKKMNEIKLISEKHTMRYFSTEDLQQFANEKNIELIHSEQWLTGKSPDESTWGVCFVGVKK